MNDMFYQGKEAAVDALAREKMIDWKYRVADHYNISREVVAVSTSILDRYVDCRYCDQKTFKLAAMVSLHLSAKVNCHTELSLPKLVQLSRGEFTVVDMQEMEVNLLKTLRYRVNPPTCQTYIQSLIHMVPSSHESITRAIYDRSTFFAELSLFDYTFATKQRSLVAIAALLNAIEGVSEGLASEECEKVFLSRIQQCTDLEFMSDVLDEVRDDLWYNYSLSTQYREDGMHLAPSASQDSSKAFSKHCNTQARHLVQISNSPVSVLNRKAS